MKLSRHTRKPNTSEQPCCSDNAQAECYFRSTKDERLRDLAAADNLEGAISSVKNSDYLLISSSTSDMKIPQVAPHSLVVYSPQVDLHRVAYTFT